jgi:periplasmic divalent cation tolerance protein
VADLVEVVVTAAAPLQGPAPSLRGVGGSGVLAHVVPAMRAVYRWDGAVHDDPQARVGLHTRAALVPAIVERARSEHPDEVPCVIALPLTGGHPDYLAWVVAETREP